jgi:hypothetical protein
LQPGTAKRSPGNTGSPDGVQTCSRGPASPRATQTLLEPFGRAGLWRDWVSVGLACAGLISRTICPLGLFGGTVWWDALGAWRPEERAKNHFRKNPETGGVEVRFSLPRSKGLATLTKVLRQTPPKTPLKGAFDTLGTGLWTPSSRCLQQALRPATYRTTFDVPVHFWSKTGRLVRVKKAKFAPAIQPFEQDANGCVPPASGSLVSRH